MIRHPGMPARPSVGQHHPQGFFDMQGGHFDPDPKNKCPTRDLEKERQLLAMGYQVVRVLQEDVWGEKNGWENFLLGELARWSGRVAAGHAAETARCPYAPEYLGGVYAELRRASSATTD